jgi:hypothetical protein
MKCCSSFPFSFSLRRYIEGAIGLLELLPENTEGEAEATAAATAAASAVMTEAVADLEMALAAVSMVEVGMEKAEVEALVEAAAAASVAAATAVEAAAKVGLVVLTTPPPVLSKAEVALDAMNAAKVNAAKVAMQVTLDGSMKEPAS